MPITNFNRLRKDLIVTETTDHKTSAKRYLIKDPVSQEIFEFREEEYFLCQLMDGVTTVQKILDSFEQRFKITINEADYRDFAEQIDSFRLLEPPKNQIKSTQDQSGDAQKNPSATKTEKRNNSSAFIWKMRTPDAVFGPLALWTKPFHPFLKLSTWLLVPLLPIALFTFWKNASFFWHDVHFFVHGMPFILTYLADILLLNFCGRVIQATVFTAYGGRSTLFGIILGLGFIPHFQVNLKEYQKAPRNAQLWIYATPLIMRLFIFSMGVIFWHTTRNLGTTLSTWVLIFAHAAFASFLIMACPLWSVYGYYFLVAAFRLPDNFISQSQKAWGMILWGRQLPSFLSTKDKWILVGLGFLSSFFSLTMLFMLIKHFAEGIAATFPGIFGKETAMFLFLFFVVIGLRKPLSHLIFKERTPQVSSRSHSILTREINIHPSSLKTSRRGFRPWLNKGIKFIILTGLVALLFLPYQTKPGGTLELLTPRQIEIQAAINGKSKITHVMFPGGNEELIPKGTVIAQMQDIDVEDQIETLQSQIETAKSTLQSRQSNLAKLLATPKKEDIEVARAQVNAATTEVETAKQEIAVAQQNLAITRQQIQSVLTEANFYSREASRLEEGYREGAIALNLVEDTQRQVETKKIEAEEKRALLFRQQKEVEQARSQLVNKQKDLQISQSSLELVLSGPYADDIEVARHNIEVARTELEGLKKEQQQERNKLKLTTLVMPLNGYLVTPYLDMKVGSYLEQGETFAIAQDATSILGEVKISEYDIGQFSTGKKVQVKLGAYPQDTIIGTVVSITPSASENTSTNTSAEAPGQFVRVLVEIPYSGRTLKTGMSGYAKIEGVVKPVIIAFTIPIVRFFQLEMWSWLP
jgi:multidrug resistance efflux pump